MVPTLRQKLDALVWSDRLERRFGRPGRALATTLRYLFALLRDTFQGQITLRSMSLVYTTLLSIVPLIAFSFSVLKGFGKDKALEPMLFAAVEPLGPQGHEIAAKLLEIVANVKGGVLGGISLAFFIYTAVSMVQKVEESFNHVWYVAKRRNFARRLMEYMVVLLIGPVLIVIALGMIASLRIDALIGYLTTVPWLAPFINLTSRLTPYLLVTGAFTFFYIFMPNTKVRFKSALIGGLAGGSLWATVSVVFASFVVYSTARYAIYSGFAVPIAALFWLYLNWLILLVGAQLAFYHQNPAFLRIGRREPRLSNAMRERLALNIMLFVGIAFRAGATSAESIHSLADKMQIPSVTLTPILGGLEAEGLVNVTEDENLLPGRDLSRIRLRDIVAVVRDHGETGSYREPVWADAIAGLGEQVDDAVLKTLGDTSLAQLLDTLEEDGGS
jgi:membrane protein